MVPVAGVCGLCSYIMVLLHKISYCGSKLNLRRIPTKSVRVLPLSSRKYCQINTEHIIKLILKLPIYIAGKSFCEVKRQLWRRR